MAVQKKLRQEPINLLPREEFAASTRGRVLAWTVSTLRFIVIVVELVVMAGFLSRFWLDARLSDLDDSIIQKQAIIEASLGFEKEFKLTQKRIEIFTSFANPEHKMSGLLETITSFLPGEILLEDVKLGMGRIEVEGVSFSEQGIAQYMSNLESTGLFEEINLDELRTNEENNTLFDFVLEILL